MWYGIVSRHLTMGGYRARLDAAIHAFTGHHNEVTQQVSLCGRVVRKRRSVDTWVDSWGMRGIMQVRLSLGPDQLCKRCEKRLKDAKAAERFMETESGKSNLRRDGV